MIDLNKLFHVKYVQMAVQLFYLQKSLSSITRDFQKEECEKTYCIVKIILTLKVMIVMYQFLIKSYQIINII
ncbi:hypothetical protein AVM71_13690 [Piscirickettsia salmonis]|nr:hypothetical protein AVM71_13690 [Piscirickettsia salmonis]